MAVAARHSNAVALPGLARLPWTGREPGATRRATGATRPRPGTARRTRSLDRPRTRPRDADRAALLLAAIAIVFTAAFVSLSQSVRVSASSYDIVRLVSERDRLDALRRDLKNDADRLAAEPAIRKGAIDLGLGPLGAPIVVPAR